MMFSIFSPHESIEINIKFSSYKYHEFTINGYQNQWNCPSPKYYVQLAQVGCQMHKLARAF